MEEKDMTLSGSAMETPRGAARMGRDKEEVHGKKEERLSKETGVRARSFYEDPDYDQLAEISLSNSNLSAPPLPGYEQRWVSMTKDNGAHLMRLLQSGGWILRDPKTVPYTYGLNTAKWGEYDAVVAGNELVLCCIRRDFYEKNQRVKQDKQQRLTQDTASFGRDLYGASAGTGRNHAQVYQPELSRQ